MINDRQAYSVVKSYPITNAYLIIQLGRKFFVPFFPLFVFASFFILFFLANIKRSTVYSSSRIKIIYSLLTTLLCLFSVCCECYTMPNITLFCELLFSTFADRVCSQTSWNVFGKLKRRRCSMEKFYFSIIPGARKGFIAYWYTFCVRVYNIYADVRAYMYNVHKYV